MGIALPPRGMHEAAVGPGKLIAPGRVYATTPWTLVSTANKLNAFRFFAVLVALVVPFTHITESSSRFVLLKAIHLKGQELPGCSMLSHAKGYALRFGQSTSIVQPAMDRFMVF